jgi:hypothetical protein
MIWLRRLLTIPLILIFVVLFVALLIATRLSVSGSDPDFYNGQLQKADAYNWVYDRFLPAALEEIEEENPDLPIGIYARDDIIAALEKTLPPEWLQERTESVSGAVIPYVVGDADEFTVVIPLKDRVELASRVIKDDLLQGDSATDLYNDLLDYMTEQVMKNVDSLPYDLSLTEEGVENALRMVFSQEWLVAQLSRAVDSVTPYLTRETDHFTIVVEVQELVDPAAEATLQALQMYNHNVYDYVIDEVITPVVEENLGASVDLPFEVSLSQEQIISAFRDVIPQTWMYARMEEVINVMAAYVKGDEDRMDVTVELGDRKAAAMDILETQADEELRSIFDSLPECTLSEFTSILTTLPPDTLPGCRPEGQSYDYFKTALGIDVGGSVDALIGDQIPDSWVYTDEELRQSIGPENSEFVDKARNWAAFGWTFSDADLRSRLDADDEETLDDVRGWLANGYSANEADLREWLTNDANMNLSDFDRARQLSHDVRAWLWAFWLIPLLLLAVIGLLGGRNWRSRLAGPLVILLVTCLGVYVALTIVQARVIDPRADRFLDDPVRFQGTERSVVELGNDLSYNTISSLASGTERIALYIMIGSAVLIAALVVYTILWRRRQPVQDAPDTSPGEPDQLRPGKPPAGQG